MFELFVLGELSDKPMHGYLLHRILSNILGPLRPVNWGTLYGVLRRLEDDGAIVEVPADSTGGGRPKKVYEVTKSGREQFLRLMARPLEHDAGIEDVFRIKVSKFHLVDVDLQRAILSQYQHFLELLVDGSDLTRQMVDQVSQIRDEERPYILAVIDYDRVSYEARLQWVIERLASLNAKGDLS